MFMLAVGLIEFDERMGGNGLWECERIRDT